MPLAAHLALACAAADSFMRIALNTDSWSETITFNALGTVCTLRLHRIMSGHPDIASFVSAALPDAAFDDVPLSHALARAGPHATHKPPAVFDRHGYRYLRFHIGGGFFPVPHLDFPPFVVGEFFDQVCLHLAITNVAAFKHKNRLAWGATETTLYQFNALLRNTDDSCVEIQEGPTRPPMNPSEGGAFAEVSVFFQKHCFSTYDQIMRRVWAWRADALAQSIVLDQVYVFTNANRIQLEDLKCELGVAEVEVWKSIGTSRDFEPTE
ncbi:hypothetical protein K488DRAFT_74171 [Vararia minispora EC-137]|uniref:Uncharacterized protein n=1 Tax=Vararia minispora EC-137 TaxID=1314806 RepID=A0ACB8Q8D9_9AGAM|nr:hypothetical protein K488DRAFT_74171 [Vararia minispora EC-137]